MSSRAPDVPGTDPMLLDSIARTVSEVEGRPKDHLEVAVILEILGYSDEDARGAGFEELFDLARAVHPSVSRYSTEENLKEEREPRPSGMRLFLAGMFYNLGWMIMLISLFLGGQSLWAAKDLPVEVSTAIGMGVVLGLVSTGGMQQFTAWKLIYYEMQGNAPLARFIMKRNLVIGAGILAGTAGLLVVVNTLLLSFPISVVLTAVYFLALIGTYRLFATPIFAFRRFWALISISISALAAMFASYFVFASIGIERARAVVSSQSIGLAVLIASSVYFAYRYVFSDCEERDEDEPPFYARPDLPKNVKAPRYWVLAYEGLPLVLYGTLYFVFIFGDRLVSWLGAGPFMINYNRTYQIGVDLALLLLIPITGVKFTYLYTLSDHLEEKLKLIDITDPAAFRKALRDFYRRMVVGVSVFGMLFLAVAFLAGDWVVGYAGGNAESAIVFKWALLGIFFFGIFLTNSVFSFCFRKNTAIVAVLAVGCVLAYGTSYILSTISPWFSVFGFVMSSFFLAAASSFVVRTMMETADHTYYQAF
ncbi:MAG: lipopolysaccharide biosynthesis protein [Thermoplasmata archaeon]